jgi:hypothetical protein
MAVVFGYIHDIYKIGQAESDILYRGRTNRCGAIPFLFTGESDTIEQED